MNLEKLTPYTITDPQDLIDEIVRTRSHGYSTCDRESSLALFSVAVPVINHAGETLAAVNVSLMAEEAKGDLLEWAINQIMAEGQRLSIILGYEGPYPNEETTSLLKEKAH
jgi:DNA-binding IclR family transcriptional regulator